MEDNNISLNHLQMIYQNHIFQYLMVLQDMKLENILRKIYIKYFQKIYMILHLM